MPRICVATTKKGHACRYKAKNGSELCGVHGKQEDCPICYDAILRNDNRKLKCGHVFHKSCVDEWVSRKGTCPMCRAVISVYAPTQPHYEFYGTMNIIELVSSF